MTRMRWSLLLMLTLGVASVSLAEPSAPETEAVASTSALETVLGTFESGGGMMWVLLVTSIVGLSFALERLFALRRNAHVPHGLLEEVQAELAAGGAKSARGVLAGRRTALARVLDGLLAREGATREELDRVLEDELGRVLWDERHNIRPVGIVAQVAPLVGLLGTVVGMINAFRSAAEQGMDNPANFASGIYQALYTTAFGLMIAIPFLILYNYLRGKADIILREVEDLSVRFIISLSRLSGGFAAAPRVETARMGEDSSVLAVGAEEDVMAAEAQTSFVEIEEAAEDVSPESLGLLH